MALDQRAMFDLPAEAHPRSRPDQGRDQDAPLLLEDELWSDCAFTISHLRMGISAGLVSDFECDADLGPRMGLNEMKNWD